MLDRFRPPSPSDETRTTCANCGAERYADEMLYDDHMEHYVCDRACFEDWADDNFEIVNDYYVRLNVY